MLRRHNGGPTKVAEATKKRQAGEYILINQTRQNLEEDEDDDGLEWVKQISIDL